jgi:hypothetical protein
LSGGSVARLDDHSGLLDPVVASMAAVHRYLLPLLVGVFLAACSSSQDQGEQAVVKGNGPQESYSIEILPKEPTAVQDLRAIIRGGSHEGNIHWERNGELLGIEGDLLLAGNGNKGDVITAVLDLPDDQVRGSVLLVNALPQVVAVGLADPYVRAGKDVVVVPEVYDPDGDEVRLSYRWSVNGVEIHAAEGPVLRGDLFRKGDRIELGILPHDGDAEGPMFRGAALVVPNAPPTVTSSPPDSLSEQGYLYPVAAEDPDGDVLSFTLEEGPEGMHIEEATGVLVWKEAGRFPGAHRIRIAVGDPEGLSAVQEYTLYIAQ